MALKFENGVITAPAAIGQQTYSLADTGFGTVAAILLFATYETAEADTNGHGIFCQGLGSYRGAVAQQWCNYIFDVDAAGSSDTARGASATAIMRGFSASTPTVDFSAALVSLGTAQFVLDWTDVPASLIKVHYVALGGSDVTDAMVGTFDGGTGTPPYNEDVTVVAGFGKPDLLFGIGALRAAALGDSAGHWNLFFGVGNGTDQGFTAMFAEDGRPSMEVAARQETGIFAYQWAADTVASMNASLAAKADWPTDGFRLVHQVNAQDAALSGFLALRGTFTAVIGSGLAPITGTLPVIQDLAVGQTPRGAIFFHNSLAAFTGELIASADLGTYGIGVLDGTHEGWEGVGQDDAAATSIAHRHHSESKAVKMFTPGAAGTLQSEADGSFSGNNVRLSWNDIDTVAREYRYLLLGDGVAAGSLILPNRARSVAGQLGR